LTTSSAKAEAEKPREDRQTNAASENFRVAAKIASCFMVILRERVGTRRITKTRITINSEPPASYNAPGSRIGGAVSRIFPAGRGMFILR
jgi:hypothetical protein